MTQLEIIFECIKIGTIIMGGLVALYEYNRFRHYGYKAQLDLDFDIHPIKGEENIYMLDIRPKIENKGRVRQKFPIIEINVKSLNENNINEIKCNKECLNFNNKLVFIKNIVHDPKDPYFIDPNVVQIFPRQVIVKNPGPFIQVSVRFFYRVSFFTYLLLRFKLYRKIKKNKADSSYKRKFKRLIEYRVSKYHTITKLKTLT